jgi:hypothetical protein
MIIARGSANSGYRIGLEDLLRGFKLEQDKENFRYSTQAHDESKNQFMAATPGAFDAFDVEYVIRAIRER